MEFLLLLIPWVIAAGWALWIKNGMIAAILCIGVFFNIFIWKKGPYPFPWLLMFMLLQLCWLAAAFFTGLPLLTLGMIVQHIPMPIMIRAIEEEKQKNKLMAENFSQQKALLYELRKQRHDLQKHASALLHSELDEQSAAYKADVRSRYVEMDHIIRGESNVMAGILYSHLEHAKENQVAWDFQIQQPMSGLPLSEFELVSFFGNILDNAIHAAAEFGKNNEKMGKIFLSCRKQSGFWIIYCQNDTLPISEKIIDRMFTKKAKSAKGENREGFGTQEVMRIVKKYRGTLDFSVIQHQFTLKIKIPDVRKKAEHIGYNH